MLTIPEDITPIELATSTIWFDETGILCAISKKKPQQTVEEAKASMAELLRIIGSEKVCLLIDVTHASENTREIRSYAAEELPKIVKALALVSSSVLGKMVANLFFQLKSQPYPVKMFNDETEAREWLKKFL